jgi:hypothetical protein
LGLVKDMWRVGLIRAPMADLLKPGALAGHPVIWIPDPGPLCFLADPMGVWRDGRLHVFVEIYDYRDRIGAIEVLIFDADLNLLERRPALKEPWHLSYPFIIEADGETYMLPEAHKSGRLTLYRAVDFPTKWAPVQSDRTGSGGYRRHAGVPRRPVVAVLHAGDDQGREGQRPAPGLGRDDHRPLDAARRQSRALGPLQFTAWRHTHRCRWRGRAADAGLSPDLWRRHPGAAGHHPDPGPFRSTG